MNWLILGGVAGDLEHKTFRGRVDHARAECVGEAQRLDPVVAGARTFTIASSRSIERPDNVMSTTKRPAPCGRADA